MTATHDGTADLADDKIARRQPDTSCGARQHFSVIVNTLRFPPQCRSEECFSGVTTQSTEKPQSCQRRLQEGSVSVCISSLEEDHPAKKSPCTGALLPLKTCDAPYPESIRASLAMGATHPAARAAPLLGGVAEGRGGFLFASHVEKGGLRGIYLVWVRQDTYFQTERPPARWSEAGPQRSIPPICPGACAAAPRFCCPNALPWADLLRGKPAWKFRCEEPVQVFCDG